MLESKLKNASNSKLSKALLQITDNNNDAAAKTGFIKNNIDSANLKIKSFRLRESDCINLSKITSYINKENNRKKYSDSQTIRGIINYIADKISTNPSKVIDYIKSSQ